MRGLHGGRSCSHAGARRRWRDARSAGAGNQAGASRSCDRGRPDRSARDARPGTCLNGRRGRGRFAAGNRRCRRGGGGATRAAHDHYGRLKHDGPCADVDRARGREVVAKLKVEHRAPRKWPEDPVHRQVREWQDVVEPSLRGRDESPLAAHPEHDSQAAQVRQAGGGRISPGTGARVGGGNGAREQGTRGERSAHCQRDALAAAPGTPAQLGQAAALPRTGQ